MLIAKPWIFTLIAAVATAVSISQAGMSTGTSAGNFRVTRSWRCGCKFTGNKTYQAYQESKTFFGNRKVYRKWSCEYACDAGRGPEKVYGIYELTNTGQDTGLEGICEGTIYESEFSSYTMREVYLFKETRTFNPRKADSPEVKAWAQENDC
ncbi:MAG: hypothetical protein NDJ89_00070 [Oligoflexia bacterium]|nr:hypothetical protein [Oligoflexia bacterium]